MSRGTSEVDNREKRGAGPVRSWGNPIAPMEPPQDTLKFSTLAADERIPRPLDL